jgi:glycerophosphoryl diester phosphodiesterase
MGLLDTLKSVGSNIVTGAKDIIGGITSGAKNVAKDVFIAGENLRAGAGVGGALASFKQPPTSEDALIFRTTSADLKRAEDARKARGERDVASGKGPLSKPITSARPASSSKSKTTTTSDGYTYRTTPSGERELVSGPGQAGGAGISSQQFGGSSGGSSVNFTPFAGAQGDAGGGRSSFTGLLGAAGTGALSIPVSTEDEAERFENILRTAKSTPATVENTFFNQLFPSEKKPAPQSVPPTERIGDVETGPSTDATSLGTQTTTTGTTPSLATIQEQLDQIRNRALELREQEEMVDPTPPEPIVETIAQLEALSLAAQGNDLSFREQFDEIQKSSGLTGLQAERIDLLKNVNAANDAIMEVYEDIKTNPDFPKGLAARRLADVTDKHKIAIQSFLGQLDVVNQMISDANTFVNRELQILEADEQRQRQARQDLQQLWKFLGDMGALGALSDNHIDMFSDGLGIPNSALKKAVANAQKSNTTFDLRSGVGGSLYQIERDERGQVLGMKQIIAPQESSGSSGLSFFNVVGASGETIRYAQDKAGNIVSQTTLSGTGTTSLSEKTDSVIQYIQTQLLPFPNEYSKDGARELVQEYAGLLGVSLNKNIEAELEKYNPDVQQSKLWTWLTGN